MYREPQETPYSDPELAKEYPLIFTSGKCEYYRHSGGRQIKTLRKHHPEPIVYIHPETAAELGIGEGEWVWVATKRGRIRQKAFFCRRDRSQGGRSGLCVVVSRKGGEGSIRMEGIEYKHPYGQ